MAKMVLARNGKVLKEIPLNKERITIGRKIHNDVRIDNSEISGEHVSVVTILQDSFLEDMGSKNGTLVNDMPVRKCILRDGDIVELCKYSLTYLVDDAAPAVAPKPPPAVVQILDGAKAGHELALTKRNTTLGKGDVQVAMIDRRLLCYVLRHVEGGQYPLLNGNPIKTKSTPLAHNDVLEIAGVKMQFLLKV